MKSRKNNLPLPATVIVIAILLLGLTAVPADKKYVKSSISTQSLGPAGGSFQVPPGFLATGFRLLRLESGNNTRRKAFRIRDLDLNVTVFDYRLDVMEPTWVMDLSVKEDGMLAHLILGSGKYRLTVSGDRGAVCSLEYSLQRPGGSFLNRVYSYVNHNCAKRTGVISVPAGHLARDFRRIRWQRGNNCGTGLPDTYRTFVLKARLSNDNMPDSNLYQYRERTGNLPWESLPLKNVILKAETKSYYVLSIGGGKNAVVGLSYRLAPSGPVPGGGQDNTLAEFRKIYPRYLRVVYGSEEVKLVSNAVKIGEDQYRCAFKVFKTVKSGQRAGEKVLSSSRDRNYSLSRLKSEIRMMKAYLARKNNGST